MGMFDTFLLQHNGQAIELQTKRFNNNLDYWQLGDVVDGAPSGIRVFFDQQWIAANGKLLYGEAADARPLVIFIVLVNAVFTASECIESTLDDEQIARHIDTLRAHWSDTARTMAVWAQRLNERQIEVATLNNRIARANRLIDYSRRSRDERMNDHSLFLALKRDEEHRLDQSENLLDDLRDVLQDVLSGHSQDHFAPTLAQPAALLDEFRL